MNTSANPASATSATGGFTQFTAVHAEVLQMTLSGRYGIDQVAKILYELSNTGGRFFIDVHTVAPITPAPLYRELSLTEMQSLLTTLQAEVQIHRPGLMYPCCKPLSTCSARQRTASHQLASTTSALAQSSATQLMPSSGTLGWESMLSAPSTMRMAMSPSSSMS